MHLIINYLLNNYFFTYNFRRKSMYKKRDLYYNFITFSLTFRCHLLLNKDGLRDWKWHYTYI